MKNFEPIIDGFLSACRSKNNKKEYILEEKNLKFYLYVIVKGMYFAGRDSVMHYLHLLPEVKELYDELKKQKEISEEFQHNFQDEHFRFVALQDKYNELKQKHESCKRK